MRSVDFNPIGWAVLLTALAALVFLSCSARPAEFREPGYQDDAIGFPSDLRADDVERAMMDWQDSLKVLGTRRGRRNGSDLKLTFEPRGWPVDTSTVTVLLKRTSTSNRWLSWKLEIRTQPREIDPWLEADSLIIPLLRACFPSMTPSKADKMAKDHIQAPNIAVQSKIQVTSESHITFLAGRSNDPDSPGHWIFRIKATPTYGQAEGPPPNVHYTTAVYFGDLLDWYGSAASSNLWNVTRTDAGRDLNIALPNKVTVTKVDPAALPNYGAPHYIITWQVDGDHEPYNDRDLFRMWWAFTDPSNGDVEDDVFAYLRTVFPPDGFDKQTSSLIEQAIAFGDSFNPNVEMGNYRFNNLRFSANAGFVEHLRLLDGALELFNASIVEVYAEQIDNNRPEVDKIGVF